MDANLVEAFKKLEAKIKDDKERVIRQEKAEQLRVKQENVERERKKQERLIYGSSLAFLATIFYLIYAANEAQIRASGGVGAWVVSKMELASSASISGQKKDEVDCSLAENWKLPVCINAREDELKDKWQNMALNKGGKEKAFAITKPE